MYADDLVIVSESATGLQNSLTLLQEYCIKWNLNININKTKCMVFNKSSRLINKHKFTIGNQLLENVKLYRYLGIEFTLSGSFLKLQLYF